MPIGKCAAIGRGRRAERMAGREPSLLARRRGEARIADDVAGREDVRHARAELRVDGDAAAIVGREPGVLELERCRRADASDGEERHVGDDALARLELEHRARGGPLVRSRQRLDRLAAAGRTRCASASDESARRRSRESRNSNGRSRRSITVTSTPSAANIDAYSMPITPAPTTASVRGSVSSFVISSLVMTMPPIRRRSAAAAAACRRAMRTFAAVISRHAVRCRRREGDADRRTTPRRRKRRRRCGSSWFAITDRLALTRLRRRARAVERRPAAPAGAAHRRSFARRRTAQSTASRNVLLGIVPVSRQMPPSDAAPLDERDAPAHLGGLHRAALPAGSAADAHEIVVVGVHCGPELRRRCGESQQRDCHETPTSSMARRLKISLGDCQRAVPGSSVAALTRVDPTDNESCGSGCRRSARYRWKLLRAMSFSPSASAISASSRRVVAR